MALSATFTPEEAREWVAEISKFDGMFDEGTDPDERVSAFMCEILEAIGNDAELGGWYAEYEEMVDEMASETRDKKDQAAELHYLAASVSLARKEGKEGPGGSHPAPRKMKELVEWVVDSAVALAGVGQFSFYVHGWPYVAEKGRGGSYAPLTSTHADDLCEALGKRGFDCGKRPGRGDGEYLVHVAW